MRKGGAGPLIELPIDRLLKGGEFINSPNHEPLPRAKFRLKSLGPSAVFRVMNVVNHRAGTGAPCFWTHSNPFISEGNTAKRLLLSGIGGPISRARLRHKPAQHNTLFLTVGCR